MHSKKPLNISAYNNGLMSKLRQGRNQKRLAVFTLLFLLFQVLSPVGSFIRTEKALAGMDGNTIYARYVFPPQNGYFTTQGSTYSMNNLLTMDGIKTNATATGIASSYNLGYKVILRNTRMPVNTWCGMGTAVSDGDANNNAYPVVNTGVDNASADPTTGAARFCDYLVNDSASEDSQHLIYRVGSSSTDHTITSGGWTDMVSGGGDVKFMANITLPKGDYEWKVRVREAAGSGYTYSPWASTTGVFHVVGDTKSTQNYGDGVLRTAEKPVPGDYNTANKKITMPTTTVPMSYKMVFGKEDVNGNINEWCTFGGNVQADTDWARTTTGYAPNTSTGLDNTSSLTYPAYNNTGSGSTTEGRFHLGSECSSYVANDPDDSKMVYSVTGWSSFKDYDVYEDSVAYPFASAGANESRLFGNTTATDNPSVFQFGSEFVLPAGTYKYAVVGQYAGLSDDGYVDSLDQIQGSGAASVYTKWSDVKSFQISSTPGATHSVTFNTQGGSAVASQTVTEGEVATIPTSPTKTGQAFAGWYKDAEATDDWNFDTDTVMVDTTIYAKWVVAGAHDINAINTDYTENGITYNFSRFPDGVTAVDVVATVAASSAYSAGVTGADILRSFDITVTDQDGNPVEQNLRATITFSYPSGINPKGGDLVAYWDTDAEIWSDANITVTSRGTSTITIETTHFSEYAILTANTTTNDGTTGDGSTTDGTTSDGSSDVSGVSDEASELTEAGMNIMNLIINLLTAGVCYLVLVRILDKTKYAKLLA